MSNINSSYIYERIILVLMMLGLAFWKTSVFDGVFSGVSLADVFLATSLFFVAVWCLAKDKYLSVGYEWLLPALIFCVGLFGGVYQLLLSPNHFSEVEYIKSLGKLGYYILASIILISFVKQVPRRKVIGIVFGVLVLLSISALYILFVLNSKMDLPYEFLYFGSSDNYISNNYYRGTNFVVAKGVFSEPSTLGIFLNLGLAYLWHTGGFEKRRVDIAKYSIIMLAIILSFSLTSYVLLLVNFVFLVKKENIKVVIKLFGLALIMISLVLIATNSFELLERAILDRIFVKVMSGSDDSTMTRLVGSWEIPLLIIQQFPIFGAGLGNQSSYSLNYGGPLTYGLYGDDGYVVFAYVLGTLGLIGLILYISMIVNLIHRNTKLGLIYLLSLFAHGGFVEPVIWVFYGLFMIKSDNGDLSEVRSDK